ncbi:hypothetical protein UFVDC4_00140 [Staphylococcus phage vB_SauM-UFV_DC4]|nr:hypothetical protein UFVDC4_00140 [Staphylococcus phage vB_SauM-UFV_DC4]
MDEIRQIEKYVDAEKLNAISNYLFRSDFESSRLGEVQRKEVLEVYMVMDRNDIQHYLAKKIEENGDKLCNSLSEFEELIKRIKGM